MSFLEDTIEKSYNKNVCFVKRNNFNYFHKLLKNSDIDYLYSRNDLHIGKINAFKKGEILPLNKNTKIQNPHSLSINNIFKDIDIKRIEIKEIENTFHSILEQKKRLENHFITKFNVSLNISVNSNEWIDLNYDSDSIFIIQIKGFETFKVLPHNLELENETGNFQIFSLKQGDLLHIPKNFKCQFINNKGTSINLILKLKSFTWYDFFKESIWFLEDEIEFRKTFNKKTSKLDFKSKKDRFNICMSEERMVNKYFEFHKYEKVTEQDWLHTIKSSIGLNIKHIVINNCNMTIEVLDQKVILFGMDKQIEYPLYLKQSLSFIKNMTKKFSISEAKFDLDNNTILLLIDELIDEGLVKIVN